MRQSVFRRIAGIALALAGNLSILGLPLAHGYAHSELAHHDQPAAETALPHSAGHTSLSEIDGEHSGREHAHATFSVTLTARNSPLLVPTVAAQPIEFPLADLESSAPAPEREARARGRPSQTAPPQPRGPPNA